eukprot:TRINITY_DN5667_c0_g1_i1.p1 TRINITY_DN5667_c0_g1~~TRINITY_DN5667_c0_g1_i1.p1  ORF type:complete len:355 (+),score=34.91 TRINITY_DN5667_c0_g1_i1:206-1270(+)
MAPVESASDSSAPASKEWRPKDTISYAPLFDASQFSLRSVAKYFLGYPGFFAPWNVVYFAITVASHAYTTPSLEECKAFHVAWLLPLFLRNLALLWLISGGWHALLYWPFQHNGVTNKYTPEFPTHSSTKFMFGSQTYENVWMSCASGVLVWSVYEAVFLRLWALGLLPGTYFDWWQCPVWSCCQLVAIPFWREFHFYWIHRMCHWKPLYNRVHYLHHKNVNPGPWSGLSMHPVEHLLYFSVVGIHMLVPSHPLHLFFNAQHTALTPAGGHSGFHGPFVNDAVPGGSYFHWLHHRYFECNYGEATIPLDRWFGTFRDGEKGKGKEPAGMTGVVLVVGSVLGFGPIAALATASWS